ncbi:hypothetical protein EMPG_12631, partial [Blastomyces silverae]
KSVNLILLKAAFAHLVCEISGGNHQFQCSALDAIQLTAEFTLTTLFEYGVKAMAHCSCVTLTVRDMCLVLDIAESLRSKFF